MSDKKLPKHMRKSKREKQVDKLVDSLYEQYGPEGSSSAFGLTRSDLKREIDPDDKKGIEKDIKDIDDEVASKPPLRRAGTAMRLGGKKSRLKKKLKKLYGQGSFVSAENAKMIQPRKAKYKE